MSKNKSQHSNKLTEQALRSNGAYVQALSDGAFEAIIISENGICLSLNQAAQTLFGCTVEDAVGNPTLALIAPQSRDLVAAQIGTAADTEYEAMAQRLDGSIFEVEIRGRNIEHQGRCVRVTALRDISDRKQAEARIRTLSTAVEQSPVAVMITDTDGRIEYVNPRFEAMSGYSPDEVIGQQPSLLKSGHNPDSAYQQLWTTISEGRIWHGELFNRRKHGGHYWTSMTVSPLRDDEGNISHYLAIQEDISAKKYAEEQFRMIATVFETTTEGIMVTNAQNRIKTVNPAFSRITGYAAEEVIGKNPQLLSSGRHDADFYRHMWSEVNSRGYWSNEVWNRRKDGSVYPEWLSISAIRDEQGCIKEYVAVFSDITRRKDSEQQIRQLAYNDPLTQLPNRSLLVDRLAQHIAASKRDPQNSALLFIDLDRFKAVNDTLGHEYGDDLLQQVAQRLLRCVRESDTVSRFGGDEFVILLSFIHEPRDAALIADLILEKLAKPFILNGREIFIGASIGITLYPGDARDSEGLLRNADLAMYQAKENGRNRYQFFTSSLQQDAQRRMDIEQQLRQALQRQELELVYQPLIDTERQTIVGVEALLRWNRGQEEQLSPGEFIPLAEDCGLIGPIGEWVLETACATVKQWQTLGHPLYLAVNISARQQHLGLDATCLQQILERTQLPAEQLVLEITESVLLDAQAHTSDWLQSFKQLGARLAIDDFGTGYSSLSYLKRFPIDILKIDQSFVSGLADDEYDQSLVRAIIAMGQSLNLSLVAEGVETEQQSDYLQQLGCGLQQGYLFARPLNVAKMTQWLQQQGPAKKEDPLAGEMA